MISLLFLALAISNVIARDGVGPTQQEWGYVQVRQGAHMFWWLHQTAYPNITSYTERPLIIWLQGGPGSSSTGFGNFGELGPLDADLKPRASTWINNYNVLFVDNPVGAGFSYVNNSDALVTNNTQMAQDFLVMLTSFYDTLPELLKTPLYIFCESYGGKYTVEIALQIDQAIKAGTLKINLVGIALGDSWISPVDSVMTWAPYLLELGILDQASYEQVQAKTQTIKDSLDAGDFYNGTVLFRETEALIRNITANLDFYNILKKIPSGANNNINKRASDEQDDKINSIMNNEVKEALGLDVTWGNQSDAVFDALYGDFMKPVVDLVETILNTTNIKVAAYSGQLDLIVDTPGTIAWVDNLQFKATGDWQTADRLPILVDNIVEGFYKKAGQFSFYWINRAGHMVPADNSQGMSFVLQDMIGS